MSSARRRRGCRTRSRRRRRARTGRGDVSTTVARLAPRGRARRAARPRSSGSTARSRLLVGSPPRELQEAAGAARRGARSRSRGDDDRRRREALDQLEVQLAPRARCRASSGASAGWRRGASAKPRPRTTGPSLRPAAAASSARAQRLGPTGTGRRRPRAPGAARRCGASCRRTRNSGLPSSTDLRRAEEQPPVRAQREVERSRARAAAPRASR